MKIIRKTPTLNFINSYKRNSVLFYISLIFLALVFVFWSIMNYVSFFAIIMIPSTLYFAHATLKCRSLWGKTNVEIAESKIKPALDLFIVVLSLTTLIPIITML